jgi:hypothetical protein
MPDFSYPIDGILADINNGLPADTHGPFSSTEDGTTLVLHNEVPCVLELSLNVFGIRMSDIVGPRSLTIIILKYHAPIIV